MKQTTVNELIFLNSDKIDIMLITLMGYSPFGKLRHLNVRGFATNEEDWFDRLHLVSEKYRVLACNYQGLITQEIGWQGPGLEERV